MVSNALAYNAIVLLMTSKARCLQSERLLPYSQRIDYYGNILMRANALTSLFLSVLTMAVNSRHIQLDRLLL